jgi:hypothetical protein
VASAIKRVERGDAEIAQCSSSGCSRGLTAE